MKPVIGINTNLLPGGPGEFSSLAVRTSYVDSVHAAGGVPILLPSVLDQSIVREQISVCDGFVFVGGPDIDPTRYGATSINPTVSKLPARRETYDFMLIEQVMRSRKPFLAVCLGCQQINVALGGTLIQDIASEKDTSVPHSSKLSPHYVRQDVIVEPKTRLAEMVGAGTLSANSAHHQAIDQPGSGLRITSRSPVDGIIESFELENYGFGIAVQWHPEVLALEEEAHLKLFLGLVSAALEHSQSSASMV
ncbi:MAG: gamma-glutamyl-gamma-aminobutyrate hydrolase family protein [Candidatus Sumerlaeaceae bacterium]